jgi:hypothetical protein
VKGIAAPLGDLRVALSEVDVLAALSRTTFNDMDWTVPDSANVEVVATLLGLIEKSSFAAMGAYHRLHRAVEDAAHVPAGGQRTDKDTSPGMSAADAAIVRRIRERDPDDRYDGGSDAELLTLFKRNRQVLGRDDEDVIAAMTYPR